MSPKISKERLQDFVLRFDNDVIYPLKKVGFERNKYNIFNILNISRQELRHSDFLAFLFDSNQSGDVGLQFLRAFFSNLAKENPESNINFFQMVYGNFDKISVKREYKRIDILIEFEIEKQKYVVVIENKIDSGEQFYDDKEFKGQLIKYKDITEKEYKNHHPIYLFLSPDKRPPSEGDWIAIDYGAIYNAISKINTDKTDNTISTLINDYKKMIREQFEMEEDRELREAALKIYKTDKDIFDFIFKNRPNRVYLTAKIIQDYISKLSWVIPHSGRQISYIGFTTKELKDTGFDFYFFLDVKQMILYFCINGGEHIRNLIGLDSRKGKNINIASIPLSSNNKDAIGEIIKRYDDFLLNGNEYELEIDCLNMLDDIFKESGWIIKQVNEICEKLSKK